MDALTQERLLALLGTAPRGDALHHTQSLPAFRDVLEATGGALAYKTQFYEIARRIAMYTENEAETLRRDLGKKTPDAVQLRQTEFVARARECGVTQGVAAAVFDRLERSAAYLLMPADIDPQAIAEAWSRQIPQ